MSDETSSFRVGDYTLDASRYYSRDSHLWVSPDPRQPATRATIGFDPLGSETTGDIVAISFEPVGSKLRRGEPFGQLEAAKFVGPLISPISGTIAGHNRAVLTDPSSINARPLESWLIELDSLSLDSDLAALVHGRDEVGRWFGDEVERFLSQGMIAE